MKSLKSFFFNHHITVPHVAQPNAFDLHSQSDGICHN